VAQVDKTMCLKHQVCRRRGLVPLKDKASPIIEHYSMTMIYESMSRKLHIFWQDAGITIRIKPNTQVATVTIVRSFFEVEEKNDIVADDEFALQRCR
jgi:hypothetical protein